MKMIQQYAKLASITVCAALLQPTPEVFALFDDVLLLREGQVSMHTQRLGCFRL